MLLKGYEAAISPCIKNTVLATELLVGPMLLKKYPMASVFSSIWPTNDALIHNLITSIWFTGIDLKILCGKQNYNFLTNCCHFAKTDISASLSNK